jgi:hypothetical protein
MRYTITITNDMQQQFCVDSDSVVLALEKAKSLFKETMVTGTPEGKLKSHTLQDKPQHVNPKKIVINPPVIKRTKEEKEIEELKRLKNVPD